MKKPSKKSSDSSVLSWFPPRIILLFILVGCSGGKEIETLNPGVLRVAVTSDNPTSGYDPQFWIRQYLARFAAENKLKISWVVVPFDQSWLLASEDALI